MRKNSFTLAEMMVVMLILTILLAAFAPLMTKRKSVDLSTPWRYSTNNSDIYYGLANTQTAMIGQNSKASSDISSRFILNTSSTAQSHIMFKQGSNARGQLYLNSSNVILGGNKTSVASSGSYNTGIGINALNSNTGNYNATLGYNALYSNTTGNYNAAIGYNALRNNTTGDYNTALGASELYSNTTGDFNTAVGYAALYSNSSGNNNTALGYSACQNVTGSNKTCIGAYSGPAASSQYASDTSNIIYLGNLNSKVIIPGELLIMGNTYFHAQPTNAQDRFEIGRMSWDGGDSNRMRLISKMQCPDWYTECSASQAWSSVTLYYSDRRLKNVGKPYTSGIEKLRDLPLYNYTFKKDKDKTPHVGVMAQDLQKIFPDAVTKDEDGYLRIRTDDMFYAVINAIKQLDNFVQAIITEIKVLEAKIDTLIKQENDKDRKIKELEKRLDKLEKRSV